MHAVLKRYRPCKTVVGGHGAGGQAGLHRAVVAHFEKRFGYAVYGGIPAVVFLVCVETGVCKAFRNAEYFSSPFVSLSSLPQAARLSSMISASASAIILFFIFSLSHFKLFYGSYQKAWGGCVIEHLLTAPEPAADGGVGADILKPRSSRVTVSQCGRASFPIGSVSEMLSMSQLSS